jgi:Trk K+ transport system NAD-binding subunit
LQFNPSGEERFQAGDELLVMGPADALETLTRLAKG